MNFVSPGQLDLKAPGTWPIYYKVILWVVLVVVILFAYNRFVRSELLDEQQSNQSEIVKLQNQYRTYYQYSLDLPLYEKRKQELIVKLQELLKFLPAETEMPSLIDKIYNAAFKSNINFTKLMPQSSIVNDYYNTEPLELSTEAGFGNFVSFVQYIGQLSRILNVRQFDLKVDDKKADALSITSNLETYIYNQDISKYIGSNKNEEQK